MHLPHMSHYVYTHSHTLYVYICIYVYQFISMYIYICIYIHICMYMYIYTYTHIYTRMYICIYMYKYVYICTPIYIYTYVCTYLYVYTDTYIYTYTYKIDTHKDIYIYSVSLSTCLYISLQVQVWLELDFLLKSVDSEELLPSQLLALVPPPPPAGWPSDFCVNDAARELGKLYFAAVEKAATLADSDLQTHSWAFVPADAAYPTRLRAARLSWMIW